MNFRSTLQRFIFIRLGAVAVALTVGLRLMGGEIHDLQAAYARVAQKAFPAVVVITNYQISHSQLIQKEGVGSGFFVSADGVIVTNYHVVENADVVGIRLEDGRQYYARHLGVVPDADLAVLKIDGVRGMPFLKFGDSSKIKPGYHAIAIGAPFSLSHTMTTGVISHVGRRFNAKYPHAYIQTDAAINPGNSGGPLLNIDGEVIGVNNAYFSPSVDPRQSGNVGIGFAIDGNLVKTKVQQVLAQARQRPSLGVSIRNRSGREPGVLVILVFPHTPAEKAGLKAGDVLLKADERVITDVNALMTILNDAPRNGNKIFFLVLRDDQQMIVPVTLASKRK